MIDPLNAFFGDQVDTHKMAAVRSVLARLQRFADRYDIAILGIMHPPKTIAGGKAINAVTWPWPKPPRPRGSGALNCAAPRSSCTSFLPTGRFLPTRRRK